MTVEDFMRLVRNESYLPDWIELPMGEWNELMADAWRIDSSLRLQPLPTSCLYANMDYAELGVPSLIIAGIAVIPEAVAGDVVLH